MIKFAPSLNSLPSLLVHVLIIPFFLLLNILLYEVRPLYELLHAGDGVSGIQNIFPFNIAIVFAIVLVSILICRLVLYFIRHLTKMTLAYYCAWCVAEVLVCSAFVALFITLISHGQENYFSFLGRSFRCLSTVFVYPYVIIAQSYYVLDLKHKSRETEEQRIRFYDNRHILKLTTSVSSILYIQADENYIIIHYMQNGKAMKYELRNSMKAMEEACSKVGIVRVHRSYLVNPANIQSVAKGEEGRYIATINAPEAPEIPVSKRYYDDIAALL